jgi:hypothetical protein
LGAHLVHAPHMIVKVTLTGESLPTQ